MLLGDDTTLTDQIIGCAMEVHRHLGPGLLESVYETVLCIELTAMSLPFKRQIGVPLYYKGQLVSEHRPDLIVDSRVIVDVKSVERLAQIHTAQMITYLRITGLKTGLVLNFNTAWLKQGVRRVLL
jgi:GxxExxY protein